LDGPGTYRSSRLGANGTGVWGGDTIWIGAFRAPNAFWATAWARLVDDDQSAGILDTFQDGVGIQRRGRARIDHRAGNALLLQLVRHFVGEADHAAEGDDGDVIAFAGQVGLAEGDGVGLVRHLFLQVVHDLVFEEDHGIVVADGLDQQSLGLVGGGRDDDLQAGNMGEYGVQTLAVLAGGAEAGAVHGAYHQRRGRLAAEHVAELGRLIEDLVEADAHEVHEHQFGHGAQTGRRRAGRRPDEGAFGDRRVEHAVAAERRRQPFGHAQHPAPGIVLARCAHAAGDVFAQQDHARVAPHFIA
jgi:hypothetical protein